MELADIVFPKKCFGCKQNGGYFCATCIKKVNNPKSICCKCMKPSIDWMTHVKCTKKLDPDVFLAIFEHKKAIRNAIKSLKYKFVSDVAVDLARLVALEIRRKNFAIPMRAYLIPVPLHKKRYSWRGFNQAEEIGKFVASQMKWRVVDDLVIRSRYTTPQVNLDGEKRRKNLKGAFKFVGKEKLGNSKFPFIVFDDVYTTGSTVREVTKVLKRNGAKKVWGLCVGR